MRTSDSLDRNDLDIFLGGCIKVHIIQTLRRASYIYSSQHLDPVFQFSDMKPPARIPDNEWQPCKPGLIFGAKSSLADELKETRRTALIRIAGICGGGVLVAGVSMFAWRSSDQNPRRNLPAAIGCMQVHQQLAAYVGNQIADQDLRASIALHLCKCVDCQRAFQDLCCRVDDACSRRKPCGCKT